MTAALISVLDVSAMCSISRREVYRWIDRGILTPVKIGRRTKFFLDEVKSVLERLKKGGKL